ncbi:acyltransferase family protein [Bacillus subtilis]|uniref:acyltransferase family protein n=1 Tax=Bacillus subtilis TaxID=1423 RepID=UPI00203EEBFC|nr:acyltransferase family protein [Bacillus subtilis]MCM3187502.1 acyltransferase family protein [Bacillus subtilis]
MLEKDLKLSNAKGLLIFLVVFGHLIELHKQNYYEIFVFIYCFHMPLFIFISGYLAKRIKLSKIINLFILYIIFQSFFDWYLYFIGDYKNLEFHFGKPQFHLWYIVSMIFWYVIALIINRCKLNFFNKTLFFILLFILCFLSRWYTVSISEMAKGFYSGFTSYTLSYQRTISFAPFFFAGFFMSKEYLQRIYKSISNDKARVLLIITIVASFFIIQFTPNLESLFRGSFGTNRFLTKDESYFMKMFLHYALSAWVCLLVLINMSNKKSFLTKWGDRSLLIFLFHPLFVFIIRRSELMDRWSPDTQFVVCFAITVAIAMVLSSNIFTILMKPFTSPLNTLKKIISIPAKLNNTPVK